MTEVTKKQPEEVTSASRDGAFICGLTLEGARWDPATGLLDDSRPKQLFTAMPVILVKAVTAEKADMRDVYQCPVYFTESRFRQEVFTAQIKIGRTPSNKWERASVAMMLDCAAGGA